MVCLKLCLRSVGSRDEINEAGLSWQTFYKAGRARRERILCIPHYHWTHNTPTVDNTLTYLALPMLMHDLLPSPGSPNETKYQRRTCHEPVNWEQNCVCVVTRAMDQRIGSVIYMYDQLGSSSISWRCLTCDLSNFGPYVRNSPTLTSDLDDTPLGYVSSQSVLLAVSSPLPPRHRWRGYKQPKLKHLLNANYKSLNNKGVGSRTWTWLTVGTLTLWLLKRGSPQTRLMVKSVNLVTSVGTTSYIGITGKHLAVEEECSLLC